MKGIDRIIEQQGPKEIQKPTEGKGEGFGEFLMRSLEDVNEAGLHADRKIQGTLAGTEPNPHSTLIALQQADISFRLMMAVKDRVVQAYTQVMQTPLG